MLFVSILLTMLLTLGNLQNKEDLKKEPLYAATLSEVDLVVITSFTYEFNQ